MRIRALDIDGFGVWSGLQIKPLSERLTVLHGPNEAGKTTLMQFIRAVLYGFREDHWRRYLPPVSGDLGGGALELDTALGAITALRATGDDVSERLGTLRLESLEESLDLSEQSPADVLAQILSQVDEPTFRNVYALELRELQELGTLSDTAAAQALYELTTGMDRVAFADVFREVRSARRRWLDAEGTEGTVPRLIARRQELQGELAGLESATDDYVRLAGRSREIEAKLSDIEHRAATLEDEIRASEIAIAVRPRWEARAEAEAALRELGQLAPLRAGLVDELAACDERHDGLQEEVGGLRSRRTAIDEEVEGLGFNSAIYEAVSQIEILSAQRDLIGALREQASRLEDRLARIDQRSEAAGNMASEYGLRADAMELLSQERISQLKQLARNWSQAKGRATGAQREASRSAKQQQEIIGQFHDVAGSEDVDGLTDALERAGQRVAQLRRRLQVDERLDELTHERSELNETCDGLIEGQLLSGWMFAGVGLLFVVGVACLLGALAGVLLPIDAAPSLLTTLAVVGIAATATAVAIKFSWERRAEQQLEEAQEQLELVCREIDRLKDERQDLDAELPAGGGPLVVRLEEAQRAHSRLEELLPLEARRKMAHASADAATARAQEAKRAVADARVSWQQALAGMELSTELSPADVQELWRGRKAARRLARQRERVQEELAVCRHSLHALTDRIQELSESAALPVNEDALDTLERLTEQASEQCELAETRRQLRARRRELSGQIDQMQTEMRECRCKRRILLAECGCRDDEQLQQLAARHRRAEQLAGRHVELSREIEAALGGHVSEEQIAQLLASYDAEELEVYWEERSTTHQDVQHALHELLEERGRIAAESERLVADRDAAEKRLALDSIEAQLRDAIAQWRVLCVAEQTLDTLRVAYQRERQPETLRLASDYLRRLSCDAYTRVWTPLDEDVLFVDDQQGRTLDVDVLSRGTREQLFLALRLAVVVEFSRRGASLPLVLDDLLVNFDAARARAAARLLCELAGGEQQILFFTCHEHIVEMFRALDADIRQLPDRAVGEFRVVEEPSPEEAAEEFETVAAEPVGPLVEAAEVWLTEPEPPQEALVELDDYESAVVATPRRVSHNVA